MKIETLYPFLTASLILGLLVYSDTLSYEWIVIFAILLLVTSTFLTIVATAPVSDKFSKDIYKSDKRFKKGYRKVGSETIFKTQEEIEADIKDQQSTKKLSSQAWI